MTIPYGYGNNGSLDPSLLDDSTAFGSPPHWFLQISHWTHFILETSSGSSSKGIMITIDWEGSPPADCRWMISMLSLPNWIARHHIWVLQCRPRLRLRQQLLLLVPRFLVDKSPPSLDNIQFTSWYLKKRINQFNQAIRWVLFSEDPSNGMKHVFQSCRKLYV